ncbi:hypothetical protein DERP_009516 [Dermatophagoides pteronyssinus]|uniref:Uncharacterized protein n=1 Tax=Dermatophagoides pteronyssinus TaxID=6956 RepID=A0ABQ8IUD6_DERPT|nr:hypothetical protein DERP_009516 [Dermatophagoides pteronyssinus]
MIYFFTLKFRIGGGGHILSIQMILMESKLVISLAKREKSASLTVMIEFKVVKSRQTNQTDTRSIIFLFDNNDINHVYFHS